MSIMPPGSESNNDAPGEPDWGYIVTHATDRYWHRLTGMCGGCGRAACHDGPCVGNANGYCTTCPTRRETGEVRGAR